MYVTVNYETIMAVYIHVPKVQVINAFQNGAYNGAIHNISS